MDKVIRKTNRSEAIRLSNEADLIEQLRMKENATRMFAILNNEAYLLNVGNRTWLETDGSVSVSFEFNYGTVILNSFIVEQWVVDSVAKSLSDHKAKIEEAQRIDALAKSTWADLSAEQKNALKIKFKF